MVCRISDRIRPGKFSRSPQKPEQRRIPLPGGAGTKSAGLRQYIGNLARAAAGSGIDGVFMEVHDNPAEALCDGPNMLYLSQVEGVLRDMIAINDITRRSVSTAK